MCVYVYIYIYMCNHPGVDRICVLCSIKRRHRRIKGLRPLPPTPGHIFCRQLYAAAQHATIAELAQKMCFSSTTTTSAFWSGRYRQ